MQEKQTRIATACERTYLHCVRALRLLPTVFALIVFVPVISIAQASEPPAESPPNAQEKLIDAQRANEEAQAEYYREQTEKLRQQKTFWQNVADNPASVLGVLGVIVAALVTLISFVAR